MANDTTRTTTSKTITGAINELNSNKANKYDDTGWINLPFNSGFTTRGSAFTPQYRKRNGEVFIRGQLTTTIQGTSATFATLPAGFRPTQEHNFFTADYYGWIGIDGTITMNIATPLYIQLGCIASFLVD